jgi:hypothetical protein
MKNLFLIFAMVPMLAISQISNWRTNPPQQQSTPQPQRSTPSTQPSTPQRNDVSSWRNEPPRNNDRQPQTRPSSNIIIRDPYWNNYGQGWNNWGWNRWDMWGAPNFGWNYWSPMPYWNDWGYRQPARIYVYDNGKRDTIRGKKPIISFGIQKTTDRQIGGFFTIGNKGYFITEYNFTPDRSAFYPYGRPDLVDFPLVDDLVKLNSFYVGFGKRVKRTGVHFMVGSINEIVRYRGKDDDGYITFPKYSNRFTTLKIGAIHDYKNFTIKFDYDPIITNGTFGLGVNF